MLRDNLNKTKTTTLFSIYPLLLTIDYVNNMVQLNVGLLSLIYDASVVYLDSYKKMLDATYGHNPIWLQANHQELVTLKRIFKTNHVKQNKSKLIILQNCLPYNYNPQRHPLRVEHSS